MTTRVTKAYVDSALERLKALMPEISENWVIEEGSRTYGRAWRIFRKDPRTGGLYNLPAGSDYLGMTAREALESINKMISGAYLVIYYQEQTGKSIPSHS